jgi:hypothetical protein
MQRGERKSLGAHPELLCTKNDDRLPHLCIGPDGHLIRALTYHRRGCVTGRQSKASWISYFALTLL